MYLLQNHRALGTLCHIEIFDAGEIPENLKESVISFITDFENKYSRFLQNSLISKLNRDRFLDNPPQNLIDMLIKSNEYFNKTQGLFDIKLGHVLAQDGYGTTLNQGNIEIKNRIIVSTEKIELVGKFDIDLGGIGKSYCISLLSYFLTHNYSLKYFLINFGGDIFVTSNHGEPLEIYLENPIKEGEYIATVKLKDSSVCGSSPFKRMWYNAEGEKKNHIISKTGGNAEFASFVFAPDIIDADVYATCLCLNPKLQINNENISYFVLNKRGEVIEVK